MIKDGDHHLTESELHDLAEGVLAPSHMAAAERHLDDCARCQTDVERIRVLLARAEALPRIIEPPGDLWPSIQARVASVSRPSSSGNTSISTASGRVAGSRRPLREYAWLAAAAVLLIVASSAITTLLIRDERPIASTEAVEPRADDSVAGSSRFRAVSDEYDRLDRDLAERLAEHREKLQPETIEKVERNLLIIDRAIAEIRQAMAEDPHNEALEQLLKASYGQKTALLQQVSQS